MPAAAQPRQSNAERRRAISGAAQVLIAEAGIEGLRTRDVAGRVGINIATLHYHVAGKEALVLLVAESVADEILAALRVTVPEGASAVERLRAVFDAYAGLIEARSGLLAVLAELDLVAARNARVKAATDRLRGRWLGSLVNILAHGVRDGSFRDDLDPAAAAAMIVAALSGASRSAGTGRAVLQAIAAELERSLEGRAL